MSISVNRSPHYDDGTRLASTWTGTFLLGRSGILDGKIATTNWQFAALFRKSFPLVDLRTNRIFTEDSGIYCAGLKKLPVKTLYPIFNY